MYVIILHAAETKNIKAAAVSDVKYSTYNVWKHLRYPILISRQPSEVTQFLTAKSDATSSIFLFVFSVYV